MPRGHQASGPPGPEPPQQTFSTTPPPEPPSRSTPERAAARDPARRSKHWVQHQSASRECEPTGTSALPGGAMTNTSWFEPSPPSAGRTSARPPPLLHPQRTSDLVRGRQATDSSTRSRAANLRPRLMPSRGIRLPAHQGRNPSNKRSQQHRHRNHHLAARLRVLRRVGLRSAPERFARV